MRNKNRVNVSVDGKYRFSLNIEQVIDLGLKSGQELSDGDITRYERESDFGKMYGRALEYCFLRPRAKREVSDYLRRKKIDDEVAGRVLSRLIEKRYLDDENFARFWVENRMLKKGISKKRLVMELKQKGLEQSIIENTLALSDRSDDDEILKIIAKKRAKYDDEKLIAYLMRQGFSYSDSKGKLAEFDSSEVSG